MAAAAAFGGLGVWSARNDGSNNGTIGSAILRQFMMGSTSGTKEAPGAVAHAVHALAAISPQTVAWFATTMCLLVLVAYATNPSDSSFRSHLTDLALHQHLRRFRQDGAQDNAADFSSDRLHAMADDEQTRASPHMLTFVNHVSVSLRTPSYERRDFGLFSLVLVPDEGSDTTIQRYTCFLGVFGKWWNAGTQGSAKEIIPSHLSNGLPAPSTQWGVSDMCAHDVPCGECGCGNEVGVCAKGVKLSTVCSRAGRFEAEQTSAKQGTSSKAPLDRRRKQASKTKAVARSFGVDENFVSDRKPGEDDSSLQSAMHVNQASSEDAHQGFSSELPSPAAELSSEARDSPLIAEALSEAQAQLEQVRAASEAARTNLQIQLDELRKRKRDEDAARVDIKSRMKTLDEHKRHAEGTRREAERRLKAANSAQEMMESRIADKAQQISHLHARCTAKKDKVNESDSCKNNRIRELTAEIDDQSRVEESIDVDISNLQRRIEKLQQRILEEEGNLQAASEIAAERYAQEEHALSQQAFAKQNGYQQSPLHALQQDELSAAMPMYGPALPASNNLSPLPPHAAYTDQRIAWPEQTPSTNAFPVPAHTLSGSNDLSADVTRGVVDGAFDPTYVPPPPPRRPFPSLRFSPFSFDESSAGDLVGLRAQQQSMTPISSDLLPSNLFQGTDDDEIQVEKNPETLSGNDVDARMNDLNHSVSQSTECEEGTDEGATGASTDGDNVASSAVDVPARRNRSWWGGRSRSKGVPVSALPDALADKSRSQEDTDEASVSELSNSTSAKRRSLSIFPKMSLNPGAKAFRGPMKRVEQEAAQPTRSSFDTPGTSATEFEHGEAAAALYRNAWNSSLGSFHSVQDYETMKRAFEAGDNPGNEERGRSARPQGWTDQEGKGWPLSHRLFGPRATHLGLAPQGPVRSSSDTQAQTTRSAGMGAEFGQGAARAHETEWLDDMILPLERTPSWGSQRSLDAGSSVSLSAHPSKPSRFALFSGFSNRNGGSSGDTTGGASDNKERTSGDGTAAAVSAAPDLPNPNPSAASTPVAASDGGSRLKRASFRWPRKASEASVPTLSEEEDLVEASAGAS